MPRTPLFASLSRALRIAACSARARPGTPPIDELLDMAYTRRRFLRDSAVAAGALATGTWTYGFQTHAANPPQGVRIAVVGAGLAGLNTAYKLRKVGLRAKVFEGSDRIGGRTFTAKDLLGAGLTTELGGEFIDSGHEEMLALMQQFKLERLDTLGREARSLQKETYYFNGRHYSQEQAAREFVPLAKQVLEHYDSMAEVVNYKEEGGGTEFDRMSVAEYFDRIGAKGWMRELLDVAYVTEYGLESGEQSALNFLFLIGTGELSDPTAFDLLGESDERYKVRGGNQRVAEELARRLDGQVERRHRLEAIKSKGSAFTLTFKTDGGVVDEDADIVVLAIPFTLLREVDMRVDLPPLKKTAIQQLAYGTNAKVLVGFGSRPWQKQGYSGSTYSDEAFQLAWDNSFLQRGTAGGLTLYSGGKRGLAVGNGTAESVAANLMTGIERAYPGTIRARNGRVSRFHWPTFPWTKGSYACYKPRQWTTIAGSEGLPVGNLYFAGEHCSYDFQGYMNGAAQSGLDTAKAIMASLSGAKAARVLMNRQRIAVG